MNSQLIGGGKAASRGTAVFYDGQFGTNTGGLISGCDINNGTYGIYLYYMTSNSNVTIESSTIRSNYYHGIWLDSWGQSGGGKLVDIHNNVIRDNSTSNGYAGVYLNTYYTGNPVKIINNTIVLNYVGLYSVSANNSISSYNNIISNKPDGSTPATGSYGIYRTNGTVSSTYDDIWNNVTNWSPATISGVGTISADPLFYDVAGSDFHLTGTSPCIGTGTPEGTDMGAFPFNAPSIILYSPNGGETWNGLNYYNITWETTGVIDTVDLYYSIDNGSSYSLIASGETNDGLYQWSVPPVSTTEAKVEVFGFGAATVSDESDAVFILTTPLAPSIGSITPNIGNNNQAIGVTIYGADFVNGATVKLVKDGQTDINATAVSVVSAAQITCNFDLNGAATGAWTLVVTNPDTQTGTGSFTIKYPPPTVSSLSPDNGPVAGGIGVTISGANFLPGTYSRAIAINNGGATLTNYQLLVTMETDSLIAANKMRSDRGDIRFLADDEAVIPYWLATTETGVSSFWVKVASIPAGSSTIHVTYGDLSLVSQSSAADTFDFYDDFDSGALDTTTKWNYDESGPATVESYDGSNRLKVYQRTALITKTRSWSSYIYEGDMRINTFSYPGLIYNSYQTNYYYDVYWSNGERWRHYGGIDSRASETGYGWTPTGNTWYNFKILSNGNDVTINYYLKSTGALQKTASFTLNSSYNSGGVGFIMYGSALAYFDNIRVRKYAATEPTAAVSETETGAGGLLAVRFGTVEATNVSYLNSTTMVATAPAHSAGVVEVTIVNADGQIATKESAYTYNLPPTVNSVDPAIGINYGTLTGVTILGNDFVSGATVKLTKSGQSDINATDVSFVSSAQLTCNFDLTGAAAGAWTVVVTNPDLQSDSLPGGFTVKYPPPTVSAVSPESGRTLGGTAITVSGQYFFEPSYSRAVAINNSGSELTDFQLPVTLETASLISAGKMLSDGGDIRFKDSDGLTVLDYWLESGINSEATLLWVKVPTVPNGNKTIYLTYGNPVLTSQSNLNNVFPVLAGSSNRMWLKANDGTGQTVDGTAVSTWTDKSGNDNNAVQATGSKQPLYKVNILNGLPAVQFSAATYQTMTNSTNFSPAYTLTYVSRQTGGTNDRVIASLSNNWLAGYYGGNKDQFYAEGWVYNPSSASDTNWHLYTAQGTGSLSTIFHNGTSLASNANGVAGPNGLSLNGYQGTAQFSNAQITELLVFNSALSTDDRQQAERYLNNKYRLYGTVPTVSVSGTETGQSGTLEVKVGGLIADGVTFISSTEIQATTPAHALGAVAVSVQNPDGQIGTKESGYTYTESLAVALRTPNGGENWLAGAWRNITWEASGTPESINLYYSVNNGGSYTTIVTGESNDGSYAWFIPNIPTTEAKIKIEAAKSGEITADESAAKFTIGPPSDYYVDPINGSNAYNGLTAEVFGAGNGPWKTLTWAATQAASGTTIKAAGGTYNAAAGESFPINVPSNRTLKSIAAPTTAATIDAENAAANAVVLRSPATLDGFSIRSANTNTSYYAVYTTAEGEVKNNKITAAYNGIWLYGSNGRASGNTISISGNNTYGIHYGHDSDGDIFQNATITGNNISISGTGAKGIGAATYGIGSGWFPGLNLARNNITMEGNTSTAIYLSFVNGATCEGNTITLKSGATSSNGISSVVDWASGTCLISRNTIEAQGSGNYNYGIYYCGSDVGFVVSIVSNEVSGRFDTGIRLANEWHSYTVNVFNNTVSGFINYGIYGSQVLTMVVNIKNCIVCANPTQETNATGNGIYKASGTFTVTYSDVYGNATNYYNTTSGVGTIAAVAQFADPANNDFRLLSNSPCIGAGTPEGTNMGCYGAIAVAPATVTLRTPNGGETWEAGTSQTITWETTGTVSSINLYYSIDGGSTYTSIVTNETDDGTYSWLVPDTPTTEAKVRIEAIGETTATDESDSIFTIASPAYPANVVYVNSVSGDNSRTTAEANNPATPWKTITNASTMSASSSTIYVAAGTYNAATGESFPITINGGRYLIAQVTRQATIECGANVYTVALGANSTVEGFSIRNTGSVACVNPNGANATFKNCDIFKTLNSNVCVYFTASGGRLIDNTIYGGDTTIYFSGAGVNDCYLEGNTITNDSHLFYLNSGAISGLYLKNNIMTMRNGASDYGIYLPSSSNNMTLEGNTLTSDYGLGMAAACSNYNIFSNKFIAYDAAGVYGIYANGNGSISSNEVREYLNTSYGGIVVAAGSAVVDHNTIVKNTVGIRAGANATIKNNIIASGVGRAYPLTSYGILQTAGSVSSRYNTFYNNSYHYSGTVTDKGGDAIADPYFTGAAGNEYQLFNNSSCRAAAEDGGNRGAYAAVAGNMTVTAESYVSPNGNDVSGVGTLVSPWRTIGRALSSTEGTVYVMAGTYNTETWPIVVDEHKKVRAYLTDVATIDSGSNGNYTVIIYAGSTIESLYLRNTNGSVNTAVVVLNSTGALAQNCNIYKALDANVCALFAASGGKLIGNTIYGGDTTIYFSGAGINDCYLEGNIITNASHLFYLGTGAISGLYLKNNIMTMTNGASDYGIHLPSSSNNMTLEGNTLTSDYGLGMAAACSNYNIFSNKFIAYNAAGVYGIYANGNGSITSNEVRGFYDTGNAGIVVASGTVVAEKNTIVKNFVGMRLISGTLNAKNNIIASEVGGYSATGTIGLYRTGGTLNSSYDNDYSNDTNWSGCVTGAGTKSADAKFLNATGNDYNLMFNSPCIDAGDPASTPDPDSSRADMGAYYFNQTISATPAVYVKLPNGGESLTGNSTYEITWYATNDGRAIDTIKLYYSVDNGATYPNLITTEVNDSSYVWTVPNIATTEVKIRIEAVSGEAVGTAESDNKFSITVGLAAPPVIDSISPSNGRNDQSLIGVVIGGGAFSSGATVKLTKSGATDINATGISVSGTTEITCNLDLNGAAAGKWTVTVTNPDTQSGSLAGGFTVLYPPPIVTSVSPESGSTAGGDSVTIYGSGFLPNEYTREVIVDNTGGSALTNYQVLVTLETASLVAGGKMRSDCGDVRFYDADNETLLSYWLESGADSASTRFWVKVPSIGGSTNKTIYLHYGDQAATSESDGAATFMYYDDFSDGNYNGWTVSNTYGSGSNVSVAAGWLDLVSVAGSVYYLAADSTSALNDFIAEADVKPVTNNTVNDIGMAFRAAPAAGSGTGYTAGYDLWESGDTAVIGRHDGGTNYTLLSSVSFTNDNSKTYKWKIAAADSSLKFYVDDSLKNSVTDGTYASGKIGYEMDGNWGTPGTEVKVDNVRVRKYAAVEPTAAVGTENSNLINVKFAALSATNISYVNLTTLTATTPAGAAGVVAVTVVNPDGQVGTKESGFTYQVPISATLMTPNGGETWEAGSTHNITWESTGSPGSFNLYYTTSEAIGWQTISSEVSGAATSYAWLAPNIITTEARVRIEAVSGETFVTDESNAVFSLADLTAPSAPTLVTPADGAVISGALTLTWEAATDNLSGIASYEIHLDTTLITQDATTSYAAGVLADGLHEWEVKAKDGAGNWGSYSAARTFTVATNPTVTTTADSGVGSLRQAILDANARAGRDMIVFNIPSGEATTEGGVTFFRIAPLTVLPTITGDGVYINGGSQTSYTGDTNASGPEIELRGQGTGGINGLVLGSVGSTIEGLAINNFQYGVFLNVVAGMQNNKISGCYLGTTVTGEVAKANSIGIYFGNGAKYNIIGGTTSAERNIISGNTLYGVYINGANTNSNEVTGNYIGLNAAGSAAIANANGVFINSGARYNVIAANIISGNTSNGVSITIADTNSNKVKGNYIGLNAAGTAAIANGNGVSLGTGAQHNIIGTDGDGVADTDERNIISGNTTGVYFSGTNTNSNEVKGNYIGLNAAGTAAVANSTGVLLIDAVQYNIIGTDGDGVADADERNIISGNTNYGVYLNGTNTNSNEVKGNYIGLNPDGTAAVANNTGIYLYGGPQYNIIGTDGDGVADAAERNAISGNTNGVYMRSVTTKFNKVMGNYVGLNAAGTGAVGNSVGIYLYVGPQYNIIGTDGNGVADADERNIISGNSSHAIQLYGTDTNSNEVKGNYIGLNPAGTAAVANATGIAIMGGQYNIVGTNSDGVADADERNIISGNNNNGGVYIVGNSNFNKVKGNYIGLNAAGTAAVANLEGMLIAGGAQYNIIGTDGDGVADTDERNIISGNTRNGIYVYNTNTNSNEVMGNYIGVAPGGAALGNGQHGIRLATAASYNVLGPHNHIANNGTAAYQGIRVGAGCNYNLITRNTMEANVGKGISLEATGNNDIQKPVISSANYLAGNTTVTGTAAAGSVIEIFKTEPTPGADNQGEGKVYLGSTEANGSGAWTVVVSGLSLSDKVTATQHDSLGDTSEFALNFTVVAATTAKPQIIIINE
ncbi:MAG: DUF2341 domain-containing protein [Candidatus Margulisiibacteriota bacterium]